MDEESDEPTGELEVTGAGNSESDSEIAKRGVDSTDKVKHTNRYTRLYRYAYTLCLKNVPLIQLAVIFTYTVLLRQFLAQMLPRKQTIKMYFIFPPHLISASALPGET